MLLIIASMWFREYLLISKSMSLAHSIARPPFRPTQGTKRPFANLIMFLILSILLFFALVSIKNTTLGFHHRTISCNARTGQGFPSPRQFQLKGFMAPGGVALQPLPISPHSGLGPLCLLSVASFRELLIFLLQMLTSRLS